jgi:hypothetical protein
MGSTPDGIADPITTIGPALPQDFEINRLQQAREQAFGCVWPDGRA